MITKNKIFLFLIITASLCCCQTIEKENADNHMAYCGQKEPGPSPEIFAPDFISKPDRYEFGSVFSKTGREVFFGVEGEEKAEILYSKLEKGVWSESGPILKNEQFGYNDPMLSPDEKRLYFISNRTLNDGETIEDYDIWYVERKGAGWSSPINAGNKINTRSDEYYISFSENGTMYFSSNINAEKEKRNNFDIYRAEQINGEFQAPIKLDKNINTDRYEADVFIAPDETYIIFCADRKDGFGRGDLYISFKNKNGNWTPSKNMGEIINSENHELCPFVSKDGKYFFYTSNQDIYWVSTEIFEKMK